MYLKRNFSKEIILLATITTLLVIFQLSALIPTNIDEGDFRSRYINEKDEIQPVSNLKTNLPSVQNDMSISGMDDELLPQEYEYMTDDIEDISDEKLNIDSADNWEDNTISGDYIERGPIKISSNSGFNIFPGSGTIGDPYIIEGYNITGDGNSVNILIIDTTVHFIARNNILSRGASGITLAGVVNGNIDHNIITNNLSSGIRIVASEDNTISSNLIINNSDGIYVYSSSSNNLIFKNNITNNSKYGIYMLSGPSENVISYNTINNNSINGIFLWTAPNNIISHNILIDNEFSIFAFNNEDYIQTEVTNNTINEKILVYWTKINNKIIPDNTGQIFLISCKNIEITNLNLSNTSTSIRFINTNDSYIHHNSISNNVRGITLESSSNNVISFNTIINNFKSGISLWSSPNNTISYNTLNSNGIKISGYSIDQYHQTEVANNTVNGKDLIYWEHINNKVIPDNAGQIILINCTNIEISNQELNNATTGIFLVYSSNLNIYLNSINNNSEYGIVGQFSSNNLITNNKIAFNNYVGISFSDSNHNIISSNIIANNIEVGIGLYSNVNNTQIRYNNFLYNGVHARDYGFDNEFSHNYWSGWTTPDNDNDDIVDNPYLIFGNAGNNDTYPQINPYDLSPPMISNPDDISYVEGEIGNKIIWNLEDANPGVFNIRLNESLYLSDTLWNNGTFYLKVDGFSPGTYLFTINVYDVENNKVSDTVNVIVLSAPMRSSIDSNSDDPKPPAITFPYQFSVIAILSLVAMPVLRRKLK